jgi:uncharacterized membrane protein
MSMSEYRKAILHNLIVAGGTTGVLIVPQMIFGVITIGITFILLVNVMAAAFIAAMLGVRIPKT